MLSRHLAVRIQFGALFHVVMVGFFVFGTDSGAVRQRQAWFFMALLCLTGTIRTLAARARLRFSESVPGPVIVRMYLAFLLHTVAWNIYTGYVFYSCFGDVLAESVMVICVAGVTSSGSNILSGSRLLSFIHLFAQMAIVITWAFFARDHYGLLMVIVMVIYLIYEAVIVEAQCQHTINMFSAQIKLQENSEELRKARDAAEQASTARSRFLASMSHEIRTPLNGLLGLAQILRDDSVGDPDERARMFDTMVRSGDHLRSIVDDILDYSKLSAGRAVFHRVALDLRLLVEEAAGSLAPLARNKGLSFEVQFSDDVQRYVWGDPVRLRQVVLNLLSNAIKFTTEGRVAVSVRGGARWGGAGQGEPVLIEVVDSGIGISPDDQQHLFQDFKQLDSSAKRRFEGTGLGLAITRQLVEQMGGSIGLESFPGRGSRFLVSIPLEAAQASLVSGSVAETADRRSAAAVVQVPPGMRILVAEDNAVNRRIAEVMLRRTGASITLAEDGTEALALHKAKPFDLIFMDANMPHMDGFETTAAIRQLEDPVARQAKIVALTANALREDRERCLAAGMDDYLAKPVRREELHAMVQRYASAMKLRA
jgi:signal transduction histidine kinase/CheY-like chemotaxis protein